MGMQSNSSETSIATPSHPSDLSSGGPTTPTESGTLESGNPMVKSWVKLGSFLGLALIVGVGIYFSYTYRRDKKDQASYEALYQARLKLEKKLQSLVEASKKDSKTATGDLKFNLSDTMAEEMQSLASVSHNHPQTYGGFQSLMLLGRLNYEHELNSEKQKTESKKWFELALLQARDTEEKGMAQLNLAMVWENAGGCDQALPLYESAKAVALTWIQAEGALGVARCLKSTNQPLQKVKDAFEKIIAAYPDTVWASQAKSLKP